MSSTLTLNEALRDVLSGMWLDWDPQAERVQGEFKLRRPRALMRPPLLRRPGPLADEFPAPAYLAVDFGQ